MEGGMNEELFYEKPGFQKCVDFHGHICPGLVLGYRAATAGMDWLKEHRAGDEEIVAVVETDSCGADAVQVVTGCTFGKGNFFYDDQGKMAFTFLSRNTGKGVRVVRKPVQEKPASYDRHGELMEKIRGDRATEEEKKEFRQVHLEKAYALLRMPLEDLFSVRPVERSLPPRARIEPSRVCARCGEPAMASRLMEIGGRELCRACAAAPAGR
jgi:formylmethanofuran dehydrogenase subunit E